jgi:lysophospholipid acyltransferase (LPLAT)-like uncharacterized protein
VVVSVSFSSKPSVIFNSWDRFMLPLPFSKTALIFGEPFKPSEELSPQDVEKKRMLLQNAINRLTEEADRRVGFTSQ